MFYKGQGWIFFVELHGEYMYRYGCDTCQLSTRWAICVCLIFQFARSSLCVISLTIV